jgi:hypothetical protein
MKGRIMRKRDGRDPWEMEGDIVPAWRINIAERAKVTGCPMTREIRWRLFAIQSLMDELRIKPAAGAVKYIVLHGPLVHGQMVDIISLAFIIARDTFHSTQDHLWTGLTELSLEIEYQFGMRFDCLITSEEELDDPTIYPVPAKVFAGEYLIIWP